LIQDQPGALAGGMGFDLPIVSLELPAYSKKENWGASETLYQLVRGLLKNQEANSEGHNPKAWQNQGRRPRVNLIGPSLLGFRCRDDVIEISRLLASHGIDVNTVVPLEATVADVMRLTEADLNICLYAEISESCCSWMERQFGMPFTRTMPIGVGATADFLAEVHGLLGMDPPDPREGEHSSKLPWYSASVDSTYLTGKRVFIFGDGSHVLAAARIANEELGFQVVGLGTYSREMARPVRAAAKALGLEALISDDYLAVEAAMAEAVPELVLGTQMERHSAKRLGIPCAVISTPMHVQDVPARFSPQMGWEGANVIFDSWVHPLMMGLEEHLIGMFRHDFEFVDGHQSHLGHLGGLQSAQVDDVPAIEENAPESSATEANGSSVAVATASLEWTVDGEAELKKIPFFVRGKVRRNTEAFAKEKGLNRIDSETLYDAKAHFSA
ncbi:MAG: ferredoxin:protochlorophyllide reductase (ATP-dependent) subunit B, partial [Synechococcus sp. BS30m-G31]|nr:ferredoxin:protochlorophyllide reductase (ATP-dependent) subunit B [Synechococcus sp. BS30m-G31]